MTRTLLALPAVGALLYPAAASAQAVVPAAFAAQEAESNNVTPFHTAACGAGGVRYQQLYVGGEIGSGTIQSIRFRADGQAVAAAVGPVTFHGVTVRLSSTPVDPDEVSQFFDANVDAVTTVFQGALALQKGASAAAPRPFDVTIPVSGGFAFDAASGDNLLLEIRITGCADFIQLDATQASPSVARLWAPDAAAVQASARSPEQGLVTQFVMEGAPGSCTPSDTVVCIDDQPADHRFRASVSYHTVQGGGLEGAARALALSSLGVARGGLFWFFAGDNPEMLLKVLDGCAANDHYWIFFAAGTNVGFTVTVEDTVGGGTWTRTNADLHAAPPVQDVEALPCDS